MKFDLPKIASVTILCFLFISPTEAGIKGGGGGRGGGGGGAHFGGGGGGGNFGGGARPSMPAPHPSGPNLGNSRPAPRPNGPSISSPAVSHPSFPTSRPVKPSISGSPGNRPGSNFPSGDRPNNGGFKPSVKPTPGIAAPTTRPNFELPSTRPNNDLPNFGRPNQPTTRPSNPNLSGGQRPGEVLPGVIKPNFPNAGRPTPGNVGDFLGLDRPVTLPADLGNRPGGNRPEVGFPNRPGVGDRPGNNLANRPGGNRPNTDWPKLGDINSGNNVINNRPNWVNIDNNKINNIQVNWKNQIGGIQNWPTRYPNRINHWHNWGNGVRDNWGHYHQHHDWFGPNWWNNHHHGFCGWHYYNNVYNRPWTYWWTYPTYAACTNWFVWGANSGAWSQPIYYDYGQGGNIYYDNSNVYVNSQPVASTADFAQSAAVLATVPAPKNEEEAAKVEWLPLGTFSVATDEKDVDPACAIQLAVSKTGIVSGTMFNNRTDQAYTVQGQVDKETQRVAFRVGDKGSVVMETGLYNLTQPEAPVLVHYGTERNENWLLVRLDPPSDTTTK